MDKKWYESKAIWGGVLVFIGGGLSALGLESFGTPIMALGVGLGFVGIRIAQR